MIPSIRETSPVQALYLKFIEALKRTGFEGELNADYANRTVLATDNSIYQVLPQGVLYPAHLQDLICICELANRPAFTKIVLSPRGGGTGTNGQSLTDGLIVDLSKHLNQILEINVKERWVRLQTGVVKDQLNAALKPHGLFFAPELSTSNRATIGGMINTDASGQGSCRYGKTRDHVLALQTVLLDGNVWRSHPIEDDELTAIGERQDRIGEIHRVIDNLQKEHAELITATFPKLNRCLTGYDLAHIRNEEGLFNLNSLLCGSEGTLGFITEAKLNLLPIPKCAALVNVSYEDFNSALDDATELMKAEPTSIETIDSKVLNLAMDDIVWDSVGEFFPAPKGQHANKRIQGINLVEYTADTEAELESSMTQLIDQLKADSARTIGYSVVRGHENVAKIWAMRKKAVGLLGNSQGEKRPIAFVEDCAVPPENLATFIAEFRQLLDANNMDYGMFGHVDAGVLHVRPAIDMKDPEQEKTIRRITDQVVKLTQKYNGLLWGEHGKGVRSEYVPSFFGELYPQLQRIKAEFDPHNQLNPGKIATPAANIELLKIDEVPTRGQSDRKIPVHIWEAYSEGMYCNGNSACYDWNPNNMMCPSWKGTRERTHSPKGRASLVREWLKQLAERNINPVDASQAVKDSHFLLTLPAKFKNTWAKKRGDYDFSNEVYESMSGCLACKSCVGQCPIKVDVPDFRSKFLEVYHGRYLRPLKDYFVGGLEFMIPTLARIPWAYNAVMRPKLMQFIMAKVTGMVDSPLLTGISLDAACRELGIEYASATTLNTLSKPDKAVVVVQDAFTSYFETNTVIDLLKLLQKLGFTPLLSPYKANGKPLHVHGFLKAFKNAAENNSQMLQTLAQTGVALIGIDPSMTLAYRSEYQKILGEGAVPNVLLPQEWLATQLPHLKNKVADFKPGAHKLLAHCTESTNAAPSLGHWQQVFAALGQTLEIMNTGCCGMAGTYGHESAHVETSKKIYQLSWSDIINNPDNDGQLTATGYSCRSQVKRFDGKAIPHPLAQLLRQMKS